MTCAYHLKWSSTRVYTYSFNRASMKVFMVIYFLQTSFGEISSEGELFVHRGKAVMLFTNIAVDNYEKEDHVVSLYINGDNNQRLIAVWILESNIAIKWLDDYYARKIFMDANQNIWIYNVEENDVGLYAIKYGKLNNLAGPEVKLTVLDELSEEEQVQKWLDDHPEIKKKYSSSSFSTGWVVLILAFIVIIILWMKSSSFSTGWRGLIVDFIFIMIRWMKSLQQPAVKVSKSIADRVHDANDQMLEEIIRNFNSERRVKNILLVGLPSAGKSSLINSFAYLILGRYIPIATVGRDSQRAHTLVARRYPHFGITEGHLRGSPNEENARRIHQHLPYLTDLIGLANENTEEMSEILSLQIQGHFEPGIRITGLLECQRQYGVGSLRSWYRNSREDWKTDVVIFVHSVAVREVPNELIQCLLNVIRPRNTLRPLDVDVYVVLTKMDKVESGNVPRIIVDRIKNEIADLFGFHGFKEYRFFELTNRCTDVGFPNTTAIYQNRRMERRGLTLNKQLLRLLLNISTPRAESRLGYNITFIQMIWFHLYDCLTYIISIFDKK